MKGRIIGYQWDNKPIIEIELDTINDDDAIPLNGRVEVKVIK